MKQQLQGFIIWFLPMLILLVATTHARSGNTKNTAAALPVEGRWDLTIQMQERTAPSWLEITHSGLATLVGQFVGSGGSARPISQVLFENNKISFSIPPQWERGSNLSFEATYRGDSLSGSITLPDGKTYPCKGVRAPSLQRDKTPVLGKPIALFNGKDLKGWHASGSNNQWMVENGILKSDKPGVNLITDVSFTDFKLQVEFRYQKNGNSGVYLRGRYEVQIADDGDAHPWKGGFGSIYGFIAPSQVAATKPGEWQSFDITFRGRMLTVVANGKQIICNQEIPGITGGALDSHEGKAGPIMLQGDHEPIEFRKIIITPLKN